MAAVPGTDKALLAAPSASGGTVLTLDMAAAPPVAGPLPGISAPVAAEPYLGMGLAAGNVTGSSSPDLVVASAHAVHLYVGGGSTELTAPTSIECPVAVPANLATRDRVQRAVLLAPLTGGALAIAVGTPGLGVPGTVSFFAADKTAGTLTCLFSLAAPAGEPEFGRSLAVGRFHQGGLDLLVGAPPAHAYIYQAPLAAGATPRTTLTEGSATGYFGAAAASLTGTGQQDSPFVSDPAATANTQSGAGVVFEFGGLPVAATPTNTLSDRSAGADDAYGSSVAALPFCAAASCATPTLLPLVGAAHKALVYFALFGTEDPRLK